MGSGPADHEHGLRRRPLSAEPAVPSDQVRTARKNTSEPLEDHAQGSHWGIGATSGWTPPVLPVAETTGRWKLDHTPPGAIAG